MWILRPTLWFTTAYTLVIVVHETAHALAAVALGMPSTLFNFWVDYDLSRLSAGCSCAPLRPIAPRSDCTGLTGWPRSSLSWR